MSNGANWKEWSAHLHRAHEAVTDTLIFSDEIIESADDEDLDDLEKALDQMRVGAEGIYQLLAVIDPKVRIAELGE